MPKHSLTAAALVACVNIVACGGGGSPSGASSPSPTPPPPTPPPIATVGVCASGQTEVFAVNVAQGWAHTRCTAAPPAVPSDAQGFALNWRDGAKVRADGLTYVAFCLVSEAVCGEIRWNETSPIAVVVAHSGGGGLGFADEPRDGGGADNKDWRDLQLRGVLVAGIAWKDTGIQGGGRFVRTSPTGSTIGAMQERVKLVYEWIYTNLNPAGKPFALAGSSGGADAVMSPFTRNSAVLRGRIALVAAVSHPIPFYDPKTACQLPTPPGTFIDKATGAAGATGAGPNPPSGAGFLDLLLVNDACSTGTMTAEMSAASVPTKEALSAIRAAGGAGYMGVLHLFVGTAATHDSDVLNGAVYGSGQIFNDPFFAQAVRKWYDGPNESHGDALDVGTSGFARLHDELASALLVPQ